MFFQKLVDFYTTEIYTEFAGEQVTTSNLNRMNIRLQQIISENRHKEPMNQHWYIEFVVDFDLPSSQIFIRPVNLEQVEFVEQPK